MSYQLHDIYDWHSPLAVLPEIADTNQYALLHSASESYTANNSPRLSFLGVEAGYVKDIKRFDDMPICSPDLPPHIPQWIGHIGYPMRHDIEQLIKTPDGHISFPICQFIQYKQLLVFDHVQQTISHYLLKNAPPKKLAFNYSETTSPQTSSLKQLASNMSRAQYLDIIKKTKEQIVAGNFYQANITRKFFGEYDVSIDPASLFSSLNKLSPSNYSALIKTHEHAVISSSPECFLKVDGHTQTISSAPIKGSMKRETQDTADSRAQQQLQNSAKDHAENLMIVDLIRHDLSRLCTAGTVNVKELAKLYSFPTIHHLISTIQGTLKEHTTHADILSASFPPGSMTGAPKIAAMQWCAAHEKLERGVYSGAIGWLGANNACEFSVVIRTILTHQKQFEFQVGGGIVADSHPEDEWLETLAKATALAQALGISHEQLAAL